MSFEEEIAQVLAKSLSGVRTQVESELRSIARQFVHAESSASLRLRDAVRRLDETRSLSQLLDMLADCAAQEAGRGAVLLVQGPHVTGWRLAGFGTDESQTRAIVLEIDWEGLIGTAIRTLKPAESAECVRDALPAFARAIGDHETRHAMALPVVVGGQVVAVLYADAPGPRDSTAPRWPVTLEVLTRYAGRVLETITVQQTTGLGRTRPLEYR